LPPLLSFQPPTGSPSAVTGCVSAASLNSVEASLASNHSFNDPLSTEEDELLELELLELDDEEWLLELDAVEELDWLEELLPELEELNGEELDDHACEEELLDDALLLELDEDDAEEVVLLEDAELLLEEDSLDELLGPHGAHSVTLMVQPLPLPLVLCGLLA